MNLLLHWYPGDAAVEFAGRIIVEISLVIGLATLLAVVAMRRRPAARHALWLGVLVCVAVAPLMLAATERAGWMWSIRRPVGQEEKSTVVATPTLLTLTGSALDSSRRSKGPSAVSGVAPDLADDIEAAAHSVTQTPFVAESIPRTPADVWRSLASVGTFIWLAGVIFLLARLLRGQRQVRQLLSDVQPVNERHLDRSLEIAAGTLGVKRLPPIVTSPAVACPVVAGLLRPTIVLPVDFVRSATPAQLADVLVHECAHALRRDTWVGLAQRLVQLAFWPHPLIYFMNRSLSRAREEVCDNYVLRRGDAVGYAQTLLELAAHYNKRPTPAATHAIFTPRWKLEDRVAGLLDPRRQHGTCVGWTKSFALIAMLVAGGSALAAGRFDDPEPKEGAAAREPSKAAVNAPPSPAAAEQKLESPANEKILRSLDKPTNVEFLDLALEDALKYLGEYHDIVVRRDRDSMQAAKIDPDHPVTLKLAGVSLRSVLQLLLEPLSLGTFVHEGELVVTTREQAATHLHEFYYELDDVIRAGISLTDLGDAITQTVDPSSWVKRGGLGSLRVEQGMLRVRQRADVREHLDDLLRQLWGALRDSRAAADDGRLETREYPIGEFKNWEESGLLELLRIVVLTRKAPEVGNKATAAIKGDRLILTQPAWIHADAADLLELLGAIQKHSGTLRPTRMFFALTGISSEAKQGIIRKRLAQPISVNFRDFSIEDCLQYVKESSKPINFMSSEEIKKAGIDGDSPVTLKADNEPFSSLLDKLLVPLKLDWYVVDPDVIVVTTRADAAGRREPRVYRTTELLAAGQTEKGLMTRLAAIEPDSWAAQGGSGQMRPLPGVLIVTHNRRVHDQIALLIATLNPVQRQPAK